jgi:uncharacterized protein YggT (Ycf19 family)
VVLRSRWPLLRILRASLHSIASIDAPEVIKTILDHLARPVFRPFARVAAAT